VTPAAWARPAAAQAERLTLWDVATLGAAGFLFLIYSQFWVFPILGDAGDPSASGLVRAIFLPAYAAGVALMALSPGATLRATARQPFLIALMVVVGLSTLWSIAPDQTARRVFAVYCTTLGGIVIAARFTWARLSEVLAACFAALAVIAFLAGLLVPSIGVMHEIFPGAWRGVWPEKNALGGIMALGFAVLAAAGVLNPRRAPVWWTFAGLSLLMVVLSTSKTSLVSLLMGLGAMIFVGLVRRGPVTRLATVWLAVVGVGLVAGVMLFAADAVFEILGKDATLTGRTKIWAAAMRQIELRPWTGYGYGVVWDVKDNWAPLHAIRKEADFTPIHAHNSWIEQWLGLGVFGLAAFGLFYLQTLALGAVAVFREKGAYLAFPVLVIYTLMTLTESMAVTYNDFRWVLFVIVAVKLAWPDREVERG